MDFVRMDCEERKAATRWSSPPWGPLNQDQSKEKDAGQSAQGGIVVQAGPVGQPGRFPFGGVERLVIDKQAVFIKPERLFELNQDLFRQVVPMLLL